MDPERVRRIDFNVHLVGKVEIEDVRTGHARKSLSDRGPAVDSRPTHSKKLAGIRSMVT